MNSTKNFINVVKFRVQNFLETGKIEKQINILHLSVLKKTNCMQKSKQTNTS